MGEPGWAAAFEARKQAGGVDVFAELFHCALGRTLNPGMHLGRAADTSNERRGLIRDAPGSKRPADLGHDRETPGEGVAGGDAARGEADALTAIVCDAIVSGFQISRRRACEANESLIAYGYSRALGATWRRLGEILEAKIGWRLSNASGAQARLTAAILEVMSGSETGLPENGVKCHLEAGDVLPGDGGPLRHGKPGKGGSDAIGQKPSVEPSRSKPGRPLHASAGKGMKYLTLVRCDSR